MLIQITNTCTMNCRHCLQNSLPKKMNMSRRNLMLSLYLCEALKCRVINISGGEPTEHPYFDTFTERFLKLDYMPMVNLLSNGMFIFNKKKTEKVKALKKKYPDLYIQICTHKDYYPKYKEIVAHKKDFEDLGCIFVENPTIYIKQLGRAQHDKQCLESANSHPYTTSCMMASSYFWHMPFEDAVNLMELNGHVCTPLIDWEGNIHLSESWLCPSIGSVSEFIYDAKHKLKETIKFKPCGMCPDYKKIMDNHTPQYEAIKRMMDLK